MTSTLALSPIRRQPFFQGRDNQSLFVAAALFIIMLIAEAAVIALAASNIPDITSLYIVTT